MSSTVWGKSKGLTAEVDSRGQLAAWLLSATDVCLAGVLFVAPYAFGARHPVGRFLLVSLCVGAALAWFARRTVVKQISRRHTAFHFVLLAACGLLVLQITPLSVSMLKTFGADLSGLLPLWNGAAGFGPWQTISVTPEATKVSLANLIAFCLLFVTVVERLETTDDVSRLLRWIAYATGAMAVFALLQVSFSNGKYFWIYELPFSNTFNRPRGSFTNQNHFASFLTLGIGAQINWLLTCMKEFQTGPSARRQSTRHAEQASSGKARLQLAASAGLLLVTVLAILLSLSRGGLGALCVGGLVAGVLYYKTGMLGGRHLGAAIAMTTLVVGVLSIYGYDQISNRLAEFTTQETGEIGTLQSRLAIWRANLKAIPAAGLCGFGVGSHREVYPAFIEKSFPVEFTHAESGYLQVSTENGVCGVVLLAAAILFPIFWASRTLRGGGSTMAKNCAIAAIAGIAAFLTHALVDFVWYVPACLAVALLLGACLLCLAQQAEASSSSADSRRSPPSWSVLLEGSVCSLAGVWAAIVLFGPALTAHHWDKYIITSQTREDYLSYQAARRESSTENPLDYQRFLTKNMIDELRAVVGSNPDNARAHLRLAANYLVMFELIQIDSANPMPISEIRSAAIASQFPSAKQLANWLQLAVGKHSEVLYLARRHTYRALQLCPLQGDAYLYLAKLSFLEGKGVAAIDEYLQQAMTLRPHAGDVHFTVGQEYLLTGRVEQALSHWQAHFEEIGPLQGTIFQILAGSFSAESLIEAYNPNWNSLLVLWNHYSQAGTQEDQLAIERHASQLIQNESDALPPSHAARAWRLYAEIQLTLGMQDEAMRSMRKGLEAAPGDYALRRQLAETLTAAEMYQEADPHLRWCMAQHPDDGVVRQLLSDSRKAWFEQRTATRQEPLFR